MTVRKLTTKDRPQYRELCRYAFGMTAQEAAAYVVPGKEYDRALGIFAGKKLIAGLWYYPYEMQVGGVFLPMGGVAAVATRPECRNRGLAKELMVHVQKHMKQAGCPTSALLPFKYSFYAKMAYAPAFDVLICEFDPQQLKDFRPEGYQVEEVDGGRRTKELEKIHLRFGERYNGTVRRDAAYWRKNCLKIPKRVTRSYLVRRGGIVCGYIITAVEESFEIAKATIFIYWLGWTEPGAARTIFSFLKSHRDQFKKVRMLLPPDVPIHHYFENPRIEAKLEPKMMFKLVDVAAACAGRPFPPDTAGEIELDIAPDPTAPWNAGCYRLFFAGGKAQVKKLGRKSSATSKVRISVPALSQLYLGYYSVEQLYQMNELDGPPDMRDRLDRAFPKAPVYIEDWF